MAAATKLKRATVFVLIFFVVELVGGIMAGSLAILTDAAHLLTDVSSFILAIIANEIASKPACDKLTYGPVRAEVLSALFSTFLILVLSAVLVYEAVVRIIEFSKGEGEPIDGRLMSIVAALGLVVNLILLFILGHDHGGSGGLSAHDHSHGHAHSSQGHDEHEHHERHGSAESHGREESHSHSSHNHGHEHSDHHAHDAHDHASHGYGSTRDIEAAVTKKQYQAKHAKARNLNVEAAALHAISDLLQSVGVLGAGLIIWYKPEWRLADPLCTLVFVVLVINSTRSLLGHALNILLEGVPEAFDLPVLKSELMGIEGVTDVHCLHIWSLTLGRTVVTAHMKAVDPDMALAAAHALLEKKGVVHSTIQVQRDGCLQSACSHPCVSSVSQCC
ncbi:cation efflux protein [Tribonema minus]|uniref:Cation efflux protein n=1 Tax=Tribonema minus TaxID=303371 RepID=A0A836CJ41_9STRA|nr:cation efflux protein [Tribonema minus]